MTGFSAPLSAERAIATVESAARGGGADQVEATLLARAGEYTRFAGDRVHQPQDITEVQVLVRAVVDGHAGTVSTSRLDRVPDAVRSAAAMARDLARAAGQSGTARVGDPAPATDPDLWHEDTAAFDAAARVRLAGRAMRAAGAAGGSAAGMIGRAATRIAVATSTGISRHAVATEATGSLTVATGTGSSQWTDLHRSSDALRTGAAIDTALARALASRGRVDLAPGSYTVVLGPQATAELLGFLGVLGFSGDLAAAGVGVCATRAGQAVASPLVTVADDAHHPYGLPIPFDVEGTPKTRVPLLAGGVVGDPVTDLATASHPTGHAHTAREAAPAPVPANVVMDPGQATEAELVAGVERGVYVERFWYTRLVDRQASTITGVSRDACFRITDGAVAEPLAGARFTQSIFDFLATVDGVGDVLRSQPIMNVWNGAVSAPAVRGHGFRFGVA
ncbi:TldD/PmbA family protein [Actinokineospora cianjurensis]|uniref:Putative Zn-dependent protease n=1 Tax=Actinokineospora cianjurensis TaxID=585224 RepID=A0A421B2C0_9PSEU|nr:TldD/PmbA family protein [Actinokineospora cianjurensis]RLK58509.1 putative Zn-dependent protease [Actinokineospora cianjurensis]